MEKILTILTKLMLIAAIATAGAAHANTTSAGVLSLWERMKHGARVYNPFGKPQVDDVEIDTTANGSKGTVESLADGVRKNYKADASILKETNAVEFDESFLAKQKDYIGRDDKIFASVSRMQNFDKPNLLITAEAGAGKTSLVHAVSRYLHKNWKDIPGMGPPKIFQIDINALVAGTTYRGDMEAKVGALLKYLDDLASTPDPVTGLKPTVILFIDEIHQLAGAGKSADGSTGLSELFKPFLSDVKPDGRVRVIGTTTTEELGFIERNKPLRRRFGAAVELESPNIEQVFNILEGAIPRYEMLYGVRFTRETLELFANMASKYVKDFVLPDPAFDMINYAGSRAIMSHVGSSEVAKLQAKITDIRTRLKQWKAKDTAAARMEVEQMEKQIDELTQKLEAARAKWETSRASHSQAWIEGRQETVEMSQKIAAKKDELKKFVLEHAEAVNKTVQPDVKALDARAYRRQMNEFNERVKTNQERSEKLASLQKEIAELTEQQERAFERIRESLPEVTREQALEAIAERTGHDIEHMRRLAAGISRILEEDLPRALPGQRQALTQMGTASRRGLRGLRDPKRPRSIFTVLDPANQLEGVSRAMDEVLFGAKNADEIREAALKTIVIDFTPPNHMHLDLEGLDQLLKGRPGRVITFANVDQAGAEVQKQLLQIAKEGRIQVGSVANPHFVDFSDTILLMHLGEVPQSLNPRIFNTERTQEIEGFLQAYREAGSDEARLQFVSNLVHQSDTITRLKTPNIYDVKDKVMSWINATNKRLTNNPDIPGGHLHIKVEKREAFYLAHKAGGLENVDAFLEREILARIDAYVEAGRIKGGEVLRVRWDIDGQRFTLDVFRTRTREAPATQN